MDVQHCPIPTDLGNFRLLGRGAHRQTRSHTEAARRLTMHGRACSVSRNQHLFRAGDRVDSIYTVVHGALKSYQLQENGDEDVLDVYFPGDAIGLNGASEQRAFYSVVALDNARLRRLPVAGVESDPETQRIIMQAMQREMQHILRGIRLRRGPSEQRLATFLLDQSRHAAAQGQDPQLLTLPLARRDLALYLGLATETLSRVFGRLHDRGLLTTERRRVQLLDLPRLRSLTVA